MTDRLTDDELDGLEEGAKLGELIYCEEILPLVAEVREHRATRTLPERFKKPLAEIADPKNGYYLSHRNAARWVVEHMTEEADRG